MGKEYLITLIDRSAKGLEEYQAIKARPLELGQ